MANVGAAGGGDAQGTNSAGGAIPQTGDNPLGQVGAGSTNVANQSILSASRNAQGGAISRPGDNPVARVGSRSQGDQPTRDQGIQSKLKLHRAILKGDWDKAERIRNDEQDMFNREITLRNETALHIAIMVGNTMIAENLIERMSTEGLKVADQDGHTALCLAATRGNKKIVEILLEREHGVLAKQRDSNGLLPLHRVAFRGRNKDTLKLIYNKMERHPEDDTECQYLTDEDYPDLLVALIGADMFDVVVDILPKERWSLATRRAKYLEKTPFHAMAEMPNMFSKISGWRELFCTDARDVEIKYKPCKLLKEIWKQMLPEFRNAIPDDVVLREYWRPIFTAVERGNFEFLRVLIRSYPELLTRSNEKGWTIFHVAIVHRQENIFALIHEIGSFRKLVAEHIDKDGNNMLHLAAQLAAEKRLEITPGAALQLRHELLWFQEVKDVVGPQLAEVKNMINENKTPHELFVKNHEDLIKRGEEWMRKTADSCIIVAILIATVAFAAAFTLPGGNDQSTGFPIFVHVVSLKIFAVADAVSFICSASSVLTFLSILTSTYALDDFVRSLPLKLLVGLSTLFVSIIAMMIAFVIAFFLYFKQKQSLQLVYAVPVTIFASVPVFLFVKLHYRIFTNVIRSTSKSLFRPDPRDPLFPSLVQTGLCKCSVHGSFDCYCLSEV